MVKPGQGFSVRVQLSRIFLTDGSRSGCNSRSVSQAELPRGQPHAELPTGNLQTTAVAAAKNGASRSVPVSSSPRLRSRRWGKLNLVYWSWTLSPGLLQCSSKTCTASVLGLQPGPHLGCSRLPSDAPASFSSSSSSPSQECGGQHMGCAFTCSCGCWSFFLEVERAVTLKVG